MTVESFTYDNGQPPSCTLSVVVPLRNEEAVLPRFHRRLGAVLANIAGGTEILYIDDGSTDRSYRRLQELRAGDLSVGIVKLTRNFGKEQAMTAGLRLARGAAVVVIDADLQDPPELIPAMVAAWRNGVDVVRMRRRRRDGETWVKKLTAHWFYRIINRLSDVPIPRDVGDFHLLSRRAVDALNLLPERNRFMKGLYAWIGFPQTTLDYDRESRAAGQSKWRYWRLWNFAIEGITAFSTAPLKAATYLGFVTAAGAMTYAGYFLFKTLTVGESVQGFPTLIVSILLLGGLQLMAIGVLGEYVGRLVMETKRRPLYLIDEYQPTMLTTRGSTPVSVPANWR